MKKTLLLVGLLLFLPYYIASQQFDSEKIDSAVRPVTLSIRFSEELITLSHVHLFRMLEKESGRSIVDQYHTLVSGSGFFISDKGHLITNHHVIDVNTVGFEINRYLRSYLERIEKRYGYLFSKDDFTEFAQVVRQIFLEGDIERLVLLPDGRELQLKLINTDESRDLALLQLEGEKRTTPLYLIKTQDIGDVRNVLSIGYPLPDILNEYFTNIQPSITSGIISAQRERVFENKTDSVITTLQHTASINAGNSGGPLVTETGLVVGVNSSLLSDANSIYFAVSVEEVVTWLEELGKPALATHRSYILGSGSDGTYQNYQVGITSDPSGAKVYVDENYIGVTPVAARLAGPREYMITIKKEGYIDVNELVAVIENDDQNFDFILSRGGTIDFGRELPSSIQIIAKREGDVRRFQHDEQAMLPNGRWLIELDGPISNDSAKEVTIENNTLLLPLDLFLKPMQVRFPNLLNESEIVLLSTAERLTHGDRQVDLSYGGTELLIRTPTYLDTILLITPDYRHNSFTIDVEYQRSYQYLYKKGIRWGLPLLISGAVLTGASIALNLDPVAVALSNSYKTYATLKYLTFGTLVTGGIAGGIGLIGTIRAVRNRNRSDEPLKVEYDFGKSRKDRQ